MDKKYNHSKNLYRDIHKKIRKIIYRFLSLNMFAYFVFGENAVNGVRKIKMLFLFSSVLFFLLQYLIKETDLTTVGNVCDAVIWAGITFATAHFFGFHPLYWIFAAEVILFIIILLNDEYMKTIIRKHKRR